MTFWSIVFFDDTNESACELTLMDYPGWDYGYNKFPSKGACVDYNEGYETMIDLWKDDSNKSLIRVKKRYSFSEDST